jgi:hypothetical protein
MGNAPRRERMVYFVGAGLSCAFGLPNTAALLRDIAVAAKSTSRAPTPDALRDAFAALYPDGKKKEFLPETVDFFSVLQAYIDIGAPGLAGVRLKDANELRRDLKMAIVRLLIDRHREAEAGSTLTGNIYLDQVVREGSVVITTNWDIMIERYAAQNGVRVRRSGEPGENYLLLLKLHGSIDWTTWGTAKHRENEDDFALLRGHRLRLTPKATSEPNEIVRVKAIENWSRSWQMLASRLTEPFLVTMYHGKGNELTSLSTIWGDAYNALSRAKQVSIVGYSLPADDLEIRTLLRAGLTRGQQKVRVVVKNPSPDVHARVRQHIEVNAESDYASV